MPKHYLLVIAVLEVIPKPRKKGKPTRKSAVKKTADKRQPASKVKAKGAKRKRKKMTQMVYEASVEADVLVVPKLRLRVAMQLPDGKVVELQPVKKAEADKPDAAKGTTDKPGEFKAGGDKPGDTKFGAPKTLSLTPTSGASKMDEPKGAGSTAHT